MGLKIMGVIAMLASLTGCAAANPDYTYADGSGNVYQVSARMLRYAPVTPELSSSGRYSGGAPAFAKLQEADFKVLAALLDAAIQDKTAQTGQRMLMTGAVERVRGGDSTSVILKSDARIKQEIESKLSELLKRGL